MLEQVTNGFHCLTFPLATSISRFSSRLTQAIWKLSRGFASGDLAFYIFT